MGRTFNAAEFRAQWDTIAAAYIADRNAVHIDPVTDTVITDVFGSGVDLRSADSGGLWDVTLPPVTPNDSILVWWTDGTYALPLTYQDLESLDTFSQRINALLEPFTEQWRDVVRLARLDADCPITEQSVLKHYEPGPFTEEDIIT